MGDGNVSACVLFLAIWLLPIFVPEFRNSARLTLAFWFVIALHQIVAVTNLFFSTLGANLDAATFHRLGVELAQSGDRVPFAIGGEFYKSMLGVVYWLLGPSHLLGQQLSILAFAVSCVVLIRITHQLKLSRYCVSILLAFGALPSMVMLGSVTLRESYQVLFFMLAVYWGIKMHVEGGINIYLVALVLSSLVMGLFHNGLIVYATFLIMLFMVWTLRPVSRSWQIKTLRLMTVCFLPFLWMVVVVVTKLDIAGLAALTALSNLELLDAAKNYRGNLVVGRTTYDAVLDLSSLFKGFYSSLVLYAHYLFSPFPWQVQNILDIYASMESFLRLTLIYFSIKHWRSTSGSQHRLLGLMLILFFSMSFMWALGTSNYGTAMRHHMLSWWIIAIIGMPMLMARLCSVRLGSTVNRHSIESSR
jgi:hypothetical protein